MARSTRTRGVADIVRIQHKFTECPDCHSQNIQGFGEDSWFCLDCEWDNLSPVTKETDPLILSLRCGDGQARREAAQALINIGDEGRHLATSDDLEPLLEALDDGDEDVRYFATVALGKLGEASALAKLKRVTQRDSSELVRQGAMTAIEWLES